MKLLMKTIISSLLDYVELFAQIRTQDSHSESRWDSENDQQSVFSWDPVYCGHSLSEWRGECLLNDAWDVSLTFKMLY